MQRLIVKSRVGADGVLRVTVPVGIEDAEKEVQVTVEPLAAKRTMTQAEWAAWVDSMAGTWQGDFERPDQGEYEVREELT